MKDVELRFLADESCDFGVVRALRAEGYDVVALTEITSRSVDDDVIAQSYDENRILLTEDKDFGQLVFASRTDSAGVILIRFPGNTRQSLQATIIKLVQEQGNEIQNAFVVVQPGHIRVRRSR
jgi:predicted nuclease of predicted toxin-antitoxin system